MYGEGKQVLGEFIRNKRASEGLDEIPDDLFAKKPRHEMSEEELQSMAERRKRNKEAAERSRKKKKVEFEKLQMENDQLNQDKCELVAMVQKLKTDISSVVQENDVLRASFEHLKRWIGKRSVELGLTKYIQNDHQNKGGVTETDLSTTALTRGDPLMNKSDGCIVTEDKMMDSDCPLSAQRSLSPPQEQVIDRYQPVARPQLQTPWLVEPVVKETPAPESNAASPETLAQSTAQLPENQPLIVASGQQVVYVPKNAFIVIQEDNQAAVTGTPEPRQVVSATPKIAVEAPEVQITEIPKIRSSKANRNGNPRKDLATSGHGEETRKISANDTTSGIDPATATAIESLLKLGYKIKVPEASPDGCQLPQAAQAGSNNHHLEGPDKIAVPLNAPASVANVTVTTSGETEMASRYSTVNPLMNCVLEVKLKDAGYAFQGMPVGSVMKA